MTKEERVERRERCKGYIRRAGSVPAAMKLAKRDLFAANTSVWIGALDELLKEVMERDKP